MADGLFFQRTGTIPTFSKARANGNMAKSKLYLLEEDIVITIEYVEASSSSPTLQLPEGSLSGVFEVPAV